MVESVAVVEAFIGVWANNVAIPVCAPDGYRSLFERCSPVQIQHGGIRAATQQQLGDGSLTCRAPPHAAELCLQWLFWLCSRVDVQPGIATRNILRQKPSFDVPDTGSTKCAQCSSVDPSLSRTSSNVRASWAPGFPQRGGFADRFAAFNVVFELACHSFRGQKNLSL